MSGNRKYHHMSHERTLSLSHTHTHNADVSNERSDLT